MAQTQPRLNLAVKSWGSRKDPHISVLVQAPGPKGEVPEIMTRIWTFLKERKWRTRNLKKESDFPDNLQMLDHLQDLIGGRFAGQNVSEIAWTKTYGHRFSITLL